MPLVLPEPIAAYFAADRADADAVARCFTDDAVVTDERRTHVGRAAIAAWKRESASRYTYTSEPFAIDEVDGRTVVASHLVGDFPGGAVDLRYFFRLQGDRIAELEIVP